MKKALLFILLDQNYPKILSRSKSGTALQKHLNWQEFLSVKG